MVFLVCIMKTFDIWAPVIRYPYRSIIQFMVRFYQTIIIFELIGFLVIHCNAQILSVLSSQLERCESQVIDIIVEAP